MIRLIKTFILLITLLLGFSCSKDSYVEPFFECKEHSVLLDAQIDASEEFVFSTNMEWNITTSSKFFDVYPTSGKGAADIRITLTARQDNTTQNDRDLGELWIHTSNGQKYLIRVMQDSGIASQTILLYMPGKQLLKDYNRNIKQCVEAVSNGCLGKGRIVICYQPDNEQSALVKELSYNKKTSTCDVKTIHQIADFHAESPRSVKDLFEFVAEYAPAKRYGLIIGSHGKAWIPASKSLRSIMSFGVISEEEFWRPHPSALKTRSFGDPKHELEVGQFSEVLSQLTFRFDFLIFDACFMSNIETLYDLRKHFDYIVASPCEIMAAGFPYNRILPHLYAQEDPRKFLAAACHTYWDFYQNHWEEVSKNAQSGCIALTQTNQIEALAAVMRQINPRMKKVADKDSVQVYEGLSTHVFYDMGHYVVQYGGDQTDIDRFNEQMDRCFPKDGRFHTDQFYSGANGKMNDIVYYSGVSFSELSDRYPELNQQTAWYRATH